MLSAILRKILLHVLLAAVIVTVSSTPDRVSAAKNKVSASQDKVSAAQDNPAENYRAAVRAYREKNYVQYLALLQKVSASFPEDPGVTYNLAGAFALNSNREKALSLLTRLVRMGLDFPAESDQDFDSLKDNPEFRKILEGFAENRKPAGHSREAFTIHEKGLITEGIAWDPVEDVFYVSSVRKRKILKITPRGEAKNFATQADGLWAVLGMKVDSRRRVLWVTTTALPQMAGYNKEEAGRAGVFKYDLKSGKLLKKYLLPGNPENHSLGDLAVSRSGDVFITDSRDPLIYVISARKDEMVQFLKLDGRRSLQGIDVIEGGDRLLVADYAKGMILVDTTTGKYSDIPSAGGMALSGIDGFCYQDGIIVAIQNGIRPHRVVRLFTRGTGREPGRIEKLEVLEIGNPVFDEPTLGTIARGSFYYIANSQWGSVDENGALAPEDKLKFPVILRLDLK